MYIREYVRTISIDGCQTHLHSYFVTCTRMSYRGSDSPNIVHPQPQGGREKKHRETPKQVAGPATDVALRDLYLELA
jgi:hypothetical protein